MVLIEIKDVAYKKFWMSNLQNIEYQWVPSAVIMVLLQSKSKGKDKILKDQWRAIWMDLKGSLWPTNCMLGTPDLSDPKLIPYMRILRGRGNEIFEDVKIREKRKNIYNKKIKMIILIQNFRMSLNGR